MPSQPFFVTGGTLPYNAPSYVERQADAELFSGLLGGEFCYVLHTRQMGKSSLMVHTARRLQESGVVTALLDLAAIGYNVTAREWYNGLLRLLGDQLRLHDELEDFWRAHQELGPLQRWMAAIVQVVLPRCKGPLVLFIDEIDVVLSLPFSVNDFFNSIRECYNRRAHDPVFERLTFCLLGVAAPTDLIRDVRVSPFNIGRRIVLTDFTRREADALGSGLEGKSGLLDRVFYWTSGHPYMTQRLCLAIAEQQQGVSLLARSPHSGKEVRNADVDALCERLFLTRQASEADSSLAFVRKWLLEDATDLAALLDMYARVRDRKVVADDETDPNCTRLRLSGIVRVHRGTFALRNRIVAQVFDRAWIQSSMPGAELRRQQAAYRLGLFRSGTVAAAGLMLFAGLAFSNYLSARRAQRAEANARAQAVYAQNQAEYARQQEANARAQAAYANRLVYAFDIDRAAERYATDGLMVAEETLGQARPEPGAPDLRGFEWYYLQHRCHNYLREWSKARGGITSVAYSPDGQTLAAGGLDNSLRLNSAASSRSLGALYQDNGVRALAFSPDGKTLAAASGQGAVFLWELASRRLRCILHRHKGDVSSVAYSKDGALLASGGNDGTARLWDTRTWQEVRHVTAASARGIWCVAFSPNGKLLATGGDDGVARLWDVATGRQVRAMQGHSWYVYALAFSPDGKRLATGSGDTNAILWEVSSGRLLSTLRGHNSYVYCLAFSRDGNTLATGSWDKTVRLWDTHLGAQIRLIENTDVVWSLAFTPDGSAIAVGCKDSTLRLWSVREDTDARTIRVGSSFIQSLAFSPDGRQFVSCSSSDPDAHLWDVRTGQKLATLNGRLPAHIDRVYFCAKGTRIFALDANLGRGWEWDRVRRQFLDPAFPGQIQGKILALSPDGSHLVIRQGSDRCALVETATGRVLRHFPGDSVHYRRAIGFSQDGSLVAFIGGDRKWFLCEAATGALRSSFQSNDAELASSAFSNNLRWLVIGSNTLGTAEVREVDSGRRLFLLRSQTGSIYTVAFSPDDARIATGSLDGTVKLWDATTGRDLLTLSNNPGGVFSLAFSPDGQHLVTGCRNGVVRIWDAPCVSVPIPPRL